MLKAAHCVMAIEVQAFYRMLAGLLTGGSAAGKDSFSVPRPGSQSMGLEERDGKEGYIMQGLYRLRVDAEMLNVVAVNRIVCNLKMKQLHCNIHEVFLVYRI